MSFTNTLTGMPPSVVVSYAGVLGLIYGDQGGVAA